MREVRLYYSDFGTMYIDDTSSHNIEARVIEFITSGVISNLSEMGIADPLTTHNIATKTLPAGFKLYAKTKFTSITLSSGSVNCY